MKRVTLNFVGYRSKEVAQRFYTWVIDGGLEDSIIDTLSTNEVTVDGIDDFDNDTLALVIRSQEA